MKKIILSIITCFVVTIVTNAQEFTFGGQAGLNLSEIVGKQVDNGSSKIGFLVGAFGEYRLIDQLGIRAELNYSQQGAEFNFDDGFGTRISQKINLNYLNIPIIFKGYLWSGPISIDIGTQVGVLLSENYEFNEVTAEEDEADKIDLAVLAGFTYHFQDNSNLEGILISLRYTRGITNIYDTSEVRLDEENELENDFVNSIFSLRVGYQF